MVKRVTFSEQNVDIRLHALHHMDVEKALRLYFSKDSPFFIARFAGDTPIEVNAALQARLDELDFSSALTVLGAMEAVFRVDYLKRCYLRRRDALSRDFRLLYKKKGNRVSLVEDIFQTWQRRDPANTALLAALRGAFRFRHWLAHGRYWQQRTSRKYDYRTVYNLAHNALSHLDLVL